MNLGNSDKPCQRAPLAEPMFRQIAQLMSVGQLLV